MITNDELALELRKLATELAEVRSFLFSRTDSIELSKTSTGKYSWTVKVYNVDEAGAMDKVRRQEKQLADFYCEK